MMKKLNYILIFLLPFFVSNCVSEFNADLPSGDIDILFVEGNIVANTQSIFYLSKAYSLNEAQVPGSSLNVKAELFVVGSDGYRSGPAAYLGSGKYQINVGNLEESQKYGLEINYEGHQYLSDALPPIATPEIDSVSWQQPEKNGVVSLHISTHDTGNKTGYYLWNYVEDWEIRSYYGTNVFFNPVMQTYYQDDSYAYLYCWKKNITNSILVGSSESLMENRIVNRRLYERFPEDDRYSLLYSVNVVQHSLTKAAYEYYSNKAQLGEDMGGLFTPQPSEVTGNIECRTDPSKKVIGFISVLQNTAEKRIYINSTQITKPNTSIFFLCEEIPSSTLSAYLLEMDISILDLYNFGFRPAGYYSDLSPFESWVKESCVDCTKRGGVKNKPDFWPNDHQ